MIGVTILQSSLTSIIYPWFGSRVLKNHWNATEIPAPSYEDEAVLLTSCTKRFRERTADKAHLKSVRIET